MLGEEAAYVHLERLVQHHLRDFTRPTMDPVVKLVELFPALVTKLDPELGAFIKVRLVPPPSICSFLLVDRSPLQVYTLSS